MNDAIITQELINQISQKLDVKATYPIHSKGDHDRVFL